MKWRPGNEKKMRKRIVSVARMVVLAAVLSGSLVGFTGISQANVNAPAPVARAADVGSGPTVGVPYQLVLEWGLRCLESPQETDGTDMLFQWPCHGGTHQKWEFEPDGAYYKIFSVYDEGCVSGVGGIDSYVRTLPCRTTAGIKLDQQRWTVSYVRDSYYEIVNKATGLCIDILNGGNGSMAVQYTCHRGGNQLWALR
jgi:hypothetical protein